MAPIHDTDLAEERWAKAEWENFELWEKIDQRLRKRRRLWIAATVVAFLLLSSVVIVRQRLPFWKSLQATHQLAREIGRLRRDAALLRGAFRITFRGHGSLIYDVTLAKTCQENGVPIRSGRLLSVRDEKSFALVEPKVAVRLGMTRVLESFCFHSLTGSELTASQRSEHGFAVIPTEDLDAGRSDRMAVVLVSGTSAEISTE